jgi:hypothetical protein
VPIERVTPWVIPAGRSGIVVPGGILHVFELTSGTRTPRSGLRRDRVIEHWRIWTIPDRTADELAVVLHGLLADSGISLCSTAPSVLHQMREMRERYWTWKRSSSSRG